ncbi:hypothetical protein BTT_60640 (plasmid) [Bacillus thuringiensis serovar morrisoni str. 4AA1]|uniref:hypothetical protein n=1 Tax=Bacillus TaxID=1386 RepID=UPI0005CDEAD5|nr:MULTISPECIES: hypothetical protein [Bacillus]AJQ62438.1 hypothetical protein SD98_29635 [Bacillus thuringiensis serovar morrisoni]MED3098413.1 hypothetical protein [Bacillus thuringiensis]MRA99981.1 hypothetical protein [Bacillus thuringiensis]OTY33046.1 hypothetical protein BK736_24380 [Bacillus thuringiensis serovar poloniensis]RNG62672.1 hypothetical protein EEL55_00710 [Bacillus thuringiensis]
MDKDQVQAHLQRGQQLQTMLYQLQKTYNLPAGKGKRNTAIGIINNIPFLFMLIVNLIVLSTISLI